MLTRKGESALPLRLLALAMLLMQTDLLPAQSRYPAPPSLNLPESGFFRPDTPLVFSIHPDFPEQILEQLGLELDELDITSLVQREGNLARVSLPRPMEPGKHVLRLVHYAADGSINELGYWELDVRQSRFYRRASHQSSGTLATSHLVNSRPRADTEDSLQAGAGLNLQLEGERARASLETGAIYNRNQEGRDADLSGYTLETGYDNINARFGDQTLPLDTLVISNYARRGASAGIHSADRRIQASIFTLLTSPVTGSSNRLEDGSTADQWVTGGWLQSNLLHQNGRNLTAQVAYVDGDGSNAGYGSVDNETPAKGRAATLVLDGTLLDQRLRLRGEMAWSNHDFDTTDPDLEAKSDHAWSLALAYQAMPAASGWSWNLGLEAREVGTWFRTLANPDLPTDRRLLRSWAGFSRDGLEVQFSAARETDNLQQLTLLPTMGTNLYTLNLGWAPSAPSLPPALGQIQTSLALARTETREIKASEFGPTDADTWQQSALLTLAFGYPSWNWGLSQGYTRTRDNTGLSGNSVQHSSELTAAFLLGERGSIAPSLAWSRTSDRDSGLMVEDTRQIALGGNYWLSIDRLSASVTATMNRTRSETDASEGEARNLSAEIAWFVVPPRQNSPGMTLKLSGSHDDLKDLGDSGNDSRTWSVFLGAEIGWQPAQ